jgi:sulfite oxidase
MIRMLTRRNFMLATAGGLFTAPSPGAQQRRASAGARMLQMNAFPTNAETPLDLLTTYITPNDLFFVRHHWNPVVPAPADWRLTIDGEVSNPLTLTLADLRRMPRTVRTCVLQCSGNARSLHRPIVPGIQWAHGAMGNARWTGVSVEAVLKRAGVKTGTAHLHLFGGDGPPGKVPPFHRSIELQKALTDCIIAYEMNGEPLPLLHGGPARLVAPGWTGNHWMKWLVRLSAQPKPQTGFFMDTGYRYPKRPGTPGVAVKPEETDAVTGLFVKSTITQAPERARVGSSFRVGGVAFSGAPDIVQVDISDDDGATWRAATLNPAHDPYAWRLWSIQYSPAKPGTIRLVARATDSAGRVQPRDGVWNQSGYLHNGWHAVNIEVVP